MDKATIQGLVTALNGLTAQLQAAGSPETRRATQAGRVQRRRWINLGAPNGYASVCGSGRVTYNGRRWIAWIDGCQVGRRYGYRTSYQARRACGGYLYRANRAA